MRRIILSVLMTLIVLACSAPAFAETEAEKIQKWVTELGADSWEAREKASQQLQEVGDAAIPYLEKAAASQDAEVRWRADEVLQKLRWKIPPELKDRVGNLMDRYLELQDQERLQRVVQLHQTLQGDSLKILLNVVRYDSSDMVINQALRLFFNYQDPAAALLAKEAFRNPQTMKKINETIIRLGMTNYLPIIRKGIEAEMKSRGSSDVPAKIIDGIMKGDLAVDDLVGFGKVLAEAELYANAEEQLQTALVINPKDAVAARALGEIYLKTAQKEKGKALAERVLKDKADDEYFKDYAAKLEQAKPLDASAKSGWMVWSEEFATPLDPKNSVRDSQLSELAPAVMADGHIFSVNPNDLTVNCVDYKNNKTIWKYAVPKTMQNLKRGWEGVSFDVTEFNTVSSLSHSAGRLVITSRKLAEYTYQKNKRTMPFDTMVSALDAKTGALLWSQNTGDSTRAYADGDTVWLNGARLVALNAADGKLKWLAVVDKEGVSESAFHPCTPLRVKDKVLIGSRNNNLYALNAATGRQVWKFKTEDEIWCPPVVVGNNVIVPSGDKRLYALKLEDGKMVWQANLFGSAMASPILRDNLLYVIAANGYLNCFTLNGEKKWDKYIGVNRDYLVIETLSRAEFSISPNKCCQASGPAVYTMGFSASPPGRNLLRKINLADGSLDWAVAFSQSADFSVDGDMLLVTQMGKSGDNYKIQHQLIDTKTDWNKLNERSDLLLKIAREQIQKKNNSVGGMIMAECFKMTTPVRLDILGEYLKTQVSSGGKATDPQLLKLYFSLMPPGSRESNEMLDAFATVWPDQPREAWLNRIMRDDASPLLIAMENENLKSDNVQIRRETIHRLSRFGEESAPLIGRMLNDKALEVRALAGAILANLGNIAGEAQIIEGLALDENSEDYDLIVTSVLNLKSKTSENAIAKLLTNSNPIIKAAAAVALVQKGKREQIPILKANLQTLRDSQNNLLMLALNALGDQGDEAARRELIDIYLRQIASNRSLADRLELADKYEKWEMRPAAAEQIARILSEKPELWEVHFNLGVMYSLIGKEKNAESNIKNALAVYPYSGYMKTRLADIMRQKGEYDLALKQLDTVQKEHPYQTGFLRTKGNLYLFSGDYAKAREAYEKALEFYPDDVNSWANLGEAYEMLGDLKQAAECYRRAFENDREEPFPYLHFWFGNLYRKMNKEAEAKKEYEVALTLVTEGKWPEPVARFYAGKTTLDEIKPKNDDEKCELYYYAAMKFLVDGDRANAEKYFKMTIETGIKEFFEYRKALGELKKLELGKK